MKRKSRAQVLVLLVAVLTLALMAFGCAFAIASEPTGSNAVSTPRPPAPGPGSSPAPPVPPNSSPAPAPQPGPNEPDYNGPHYGRTCGTASIGVTEPAKTWYMAEGSTAGGFETWVLVQNPGDEIATASLDFMTDKGEVAGPILKLAPMSRQSIRVNDSVRAFSVSTEVTSDQPVVAERSTYFTPPGFDHRVVAHSHIGITTPATTWYLAEGATAGGFQTWVLVQNPGDQVANVSLDYMTDRGEVAGPTIVLAAKSRQSVKVDDTVKTMSVSTKVTSDRPVIVERSVYFRPPESDHWMCGTSSTGVNGPATTWYMAEGSTAGGFETWVLVQNPGDEIATVKLTYMTDRGAVEGPTIQLAPKSRQTVSVDKTVHSFNVSSMVTSDRPVIAERAVYKRTRGRDDQPPGGPQ